MKKAKHVLMVIGLWAFLLLPMPSEAWVSVPALGGTDPNAWQHYSYTFNDGFDGTVGFVASNVIDDGYSSYLMIKGLSQGGDYNGTVVGDGSVAAQFIHTLSGNTYGGPLFLLRSPDYIDNPGGFADTSSYSNYQGDPGTHGSILALSITVSEGAAFSFDWAFATDDMDPGLDFSRVYFNGVDGVTNPINLQGELGQVATVPVPAAVWLLGSGLVGLIGLRRKIKG